MIFEITSFTATTLNSLYSFGQYNYRMEVLGDSTNNMHYAPLSIGTGSIILAINMTSASIQWQYEYGLPVRHPRLSSDK